MKPSIVRAALFATCVVVFSALVHARALAIVEYCGATVQLVPVDGATLVSPATVFAMTFSADTPRTVSGHVAVHSQDGTWYDIAFSNVDLKLRSRRYQTPSALFTHKDAASAPLFVAFRSALHFTTAFVSSVTVTNEHVLGWDSQEHRCAGSDPDPSFVKHVWGSNILPLDPDPKPTMPPPGSPLLQPAVRSAPGPTDCAVPFAEARITRAVAPDFPVAYSMGQTYVSLIEVAVNEKGSLDDAWVYGPSGVKVLDDEALRAARLSTYQPRRSFCGDVPGIYLFRAEFHPN